MAMTKTFLISWAFALTLASEAAVAITANLVSNLNCSIKSSNGIFFAAHARRRVTH
jgi:hypothetical protein